jgi:hypothetical protein
MAFIDFREFEDPSAQQIIVTREDGRSARQFAPRSTLSSTVFGQRVAALHSATSNLAIGASKEVERLSPVGFAAHVRSNVVGPMATAWRDLRSAAINQQIELEKQRQDWLRGGPTPDPVRQAEIRGHLRSVKQVDAARLALTELEFGRAVIDAPALSNVPLDLIPRIEEALIEGNLTARYATIHKRKPTTDDLFGNGPDVETAARLAKEAVTIHRRANVPLSLKERALRT